MLGIDPIEHNSMQGQSREIDEIPYGNSENDGALLPEPHPYSTHSTC